MPFKLGSNDVSKLYLGSNEITKAYLGSNVIIEPTAGLPSLAKHTGYWDAGSSTTFTDQTTNGYNGTVTTVGGGGTSSVTHVAGATPYWQFDAPSSTSEQSYVLSGYSWGAMAAGDQWTWWSVFQAPSLSYNSSLFTALDSGTDTIGTGVSRNTNRIYQNVRNGSQSNLAGSTTVTINQWLLVMTVATGTQYELYLNNGLEATNTSPIAVDVATQMYLGGWFTSSTVRNNFKFAAGGWMKGTSLNATERTDLYNYYDAIYSF